MKKILYAGLLCLLVAALTVAAAVAGNVHLTGSTSFSLGSLIVNGTVVGLASSGVPQATVRFVGYGYCYTSTGAYWTPTDPNQMDDDPNTSDDYPETRLVLAPNNNKATFRLEMDNPGPGSTSAPAAPCAPGTWVWTGATLQVWSSSGSTLISLLSQQNYACTANKQGGFDCK